MELKLYTQLLPKHFTYRLNCTVMELKLATSEQFMILDRVLIVPLWN